jgi:quercetin dioxygenase-like cupin family protein
MQSKTYQKIERYSPEKFVHVPVFHGARAQVLLLCLSPGQEVPPHSHPGYEITLQPLQGKALLPVAEGKEAVLEPGDIHFVEGEGSFSPRNPFPENFQMLIHLVQK